MFSEIPYGIKLGCSLDKLRSCDPDITELPDGFIAHDGIDSSDYGYAEGLFSVTISYDMSDDDFLDSVTVYCVYGSDSIFSKDTSLFDAICDGMTKQYGNPDDAVIPIAQTWHDENMDITVTYISYSDSANRLIAVDFTTSNDT